VLHVASEVAPFAQSGGLADVLAGLPGAEAGHGLDTAVLVPLYRGVADKLAADGLALAPAAVVPLEVGVHRLEVAIRTAQIAGVRHGFLECAQLYDHAGGLYGPHGAGEFADNALRFAALGKAAVTAGEALLGGAPDILHLHDWQAGAAAIYARLAELPARIVTTIHNLAYRGIFSKDVMTELGIPWSMFTVEQVEFYDQISFLKAGLALADAVTTVSPTYAQEILTPERGEALDGFLRTRPRLVGIANGIDTSVWDPAADPLLAAAFSHDRPAGKATCRARLAEEMGLPLRDDEVLIGVVARMTDQKGLDLVADIVPELARLGARLVVLGSGEPALEQRFTWLAEVFAEHVAVRISFDANLAHRIYAGSDVFAMPSRFEPCGLGQLYAMRYGAIPVAHAVGGLRDTVRDPGDAELAQGHGTGVLFAPALTSELVHGLERVVALLRDAGTRATLRRAAMLRDSSWTASALEYVRLYDSLVA